MKKTGILTFHYSNNHGGVLQSYALYDYLKSQNVDVEIINYTRSRYKYDKIILNTGIEQGEALGDVLQRIRIRRRFGKAIDEAFNRFRDTNLTMSVRVDERSIASVLADYGTIIVGSDQVWNPSMRGSNVYFLGFGESFCGTKISYAADSTTSDIDPKYTAKLRRELSDFKAISVRNEHSREFVEKLIGKTVPIVADPVVLCDFSKLNLENIPTHSEERYIFVYVLGEDIKGSNKQAVDKIRKVYGDMKVYAVVDPTKKVNLNVFDYADEVYYDLGPEEWIGTLSNAAFVYTDSFHGTLFALKFHRPFLAYYVEPSRATRFVDLGNRYKIDDFIVSSIDEIEAKGSLEKPPDFDMIDDVMEDHKRTSIQFLYAALDVS